MKKLLFSFFGLILLDTTCLWAHTGTQTTLKRGVYKYVITKDQIMADNGNWSSGAKNTLTFGPDITYTGYGANSTIYDDKKGGKWPRIYQTQNVVEGTPGGSVISANNGWIDSICIEYNVVSLGVISLTKENTSPVATDMQIASGKMHKVNAASFPFYIGVSSGTGTTGRADITKITIYYRKYPTSISLQNRTISVGNRFQLLPDPTPADAYPSYTWETDNADAVAINATTGVLEAKAAGEATITATSINGKVASCKIKVEANDLKSFTDTIKSATTVKSYQGQTADVQYTGDNGVFHWIMRNFRRYSPDDVVDGVQWTRLAYNGASGHEGKDYIAYDTPYEGGVKRISFQWKAASKNNPVSLDIDNNSKPDGLISYKTYILASSANQSVTTYMRDLDMAKNVQLRLSITASEGSVVTISPITITPYLLFTNKTVDATDGFYKFKDADLINNTGVTLAKANFEVSDNDAASIDDDGTIRSKQDNKTITLTAKWGDVTTTTKLTTHLVDPAGSFGTKLVTRSVGDAQFTEVFTKTVGNVFSYVSTNTDVATVDPISGEVTIVNAGTTKIKAVFETSAPYNAKEFFYTLDVRQVPETGKFWKETFSQVQGGTGDNATTSEDVDGDDGIEDKWKLTNFFHKDVIDTLTGVRLRYSSAITSNAALEGGLKEVYFDYRVASQAFPVVFDVQAGDQSHNYTHDTLPTAETIIPYYHKFEVKSAAILSISNAAKIGTGQAHPVIGAIQVVPYLLFTSKSADADCKVSESYDLNQVLIDNTEGDNKPQFTITNNTTGGEVTIQNKQVDLSKAKKNGVVAITASWEGVTTTFTLNVTAMTVPASNFAAPVVTKQIGDDAFTNELTTDAVGTKKFTSTNEDVASVDPSSGKVTIVNGGTTQIKVELGKASPYRDTTLFYTLDVQHTPAVGTYWNEKFNNNHYTGTRNVTDTIVGDNNVYTWSMSTYRRSEEDTVHLGEQGIRVRDNIKMIKKPEGGIKEVSFDFKAVNDINPVHFKVKVGENEQEYLREKVSSTSTVFQYAYQFEQDSNDSLAITYVTGGTYLTVGSIKIVPYLLYTTKDTTASASGGAFTNDKIIDNTTGDEPYYSISCDEDVATIDHATGAVTIYQTETAVVTATWGNVSTSYTLRMQANPIPEIRFESASLTKDLYDADFTNTFTTPAGVGDTTYTSSNEEVATVNTKGEVKILSAGVTTITASVEENDNYAANSVSYNLTVGFTPTETGWKETFSKCTSAGGTGSGVSAEVDGDDGTIKKWQLIKFQRRSKDDKVGKEQGIQVRYSGSIANKVDLEGGIKDISFNWRPTNQVNVNHFWVNVNGTDYACNNPIIYDKDSILLYARKFDAKTNASSLAIKMDEQHSLQQAFPLIGELKVTPYILYTRKDTTIRAFDYLNEKFENDKLINNTDKVGVTYAIEDAANKADVAVIEDATKNEVTIKGEGQVKVIASWQGVTTSYTLHITKVTPTITLAGDTIDVFGSYVPAPVVTFEGKEITGAVVNYTAGSNNVVRVENNQIKINHAGETTIKATLVAGAYYNTKDTTVNLKIDEPAGDTIWKETFSSMAEKTAFQGKIEVDGEVYPWQIRNYRRDFTKDLVNGEKGIQMRFGSADNENYIAFNGNKEMGGVKAFFFNWRTAYTSTKDVNFTVRIESADKSKPYNQTFSYQQVAPGEYFSCAQTINCTKDGMFRIGLPNSTDSVVFGPITIVPYLLYTTREVSIDAKDYAGVEWKYNGNPLAINNTGGTVTYSIENEAQKANIAIIDSETGAITIKGGGTVKVLASWEQVSTSYNLTINMEETSLEFDAPSYSAQLKDGSFQKIVSKTGESTEEPVYSFEGEHKATTTIDGSTVSFTATDTVVVMATIAKHLPYAEDTARYTLYITSLNVPEMSFEDPSKTLDMNGSGYKNVLTTSVGVGDTTYTSSNERVAKVAADGTITVWGVGTTTITARVEERGSFAAREISYELTTEPAADEVIAETFENDGDWQGAVTSVTTIVGKQFDWSTYLTRHRKDGSTSTADRLNNGERAVWFNTSGNAYLESAAAIEGGIKRVSFNWNKANVANPTISVVVGGGTPIDLDATGQVGEDISFHQNFFVKENATLRINNNSASVLLVGTINITPYLMYKTKTVNLSSVEHAKETTYENTDLINNTGVTVEAGQTAIVFSIKDQSDATDKIATINAQTGVVTLKGLGTVTVQATWDGIVTTYELTIAMPKPVISGLNATAINLDGGSYKPTITTTIGGQPIAEPKLTYTSANENTAYVDNGTYKPVASGKVNMKVTLEAGTYNGYPYESVNTGNKELTINAYTLEGNFVENFTKLNMGAKADTTFYGDDSVYTWTAHKFNKTSAGIIMSKETNNVGYVTMNGTQEGGIKYVTFGWGAENPEANIPVGFILKMNETSYTYHHTSAASTKGYTVERMFNQMTNSQFSVEVEEGSNKNIYVKPVTIVPYLLYTKKNCTLDMKYGNTFKNTNLINNLGNNVTIFYSFVEGKVDFADIATDGTVTASSSGEVTVKAKYSDDLYTTYKLTILAGATKIKLVRNDGTENYDEITNNRDEAMPAITNPTRKGYGFNGYYTATEGGTRFTMTPYEEQTRWVDNRTVDGVTYVDANRKWVFGGSNYTLYAQWVEEKTITLDNQGADTKGTESVQIALCQYNYTVNLSSKSITKPTKEGRTFQGYYTEAEGQGKKLIDNNGDFIASVPDYTDQYKRWIKNENIQLYAYWTVTQQDVSTTKNATEYPEYSDMSIADGGTLLMNENREFNSVTINEGGAVTINSTLTVKNLVIKSNMSDAKSNSGQVTGLTSETSSKLNITEGAYYDLTLADDANPNKWHAFAVPFQVDMMNGIYDANDTKLTNEVNYAIMVYQGDVRAQGKYGWIKVPKTGNTILQPGTFYLMTVDGDVKTFRFKMYGDFAVADKEIDVTKYIGTGADTDAGWNGIGNNQLEYVSIDKKVQVLNMSSNTFEGKLASSIDFIVGMPFFYQADATGQVTLANPIGGQQIAARRMGDAEIKDVDITLANADYTDHLYISATDEATNEYQIGRDLSKMTMTSTPTVPQIFAKAYGSKLCMIDVPMAGDEATYALSLYAPKDGEYTMAAAQVAGYEIYLTHKGEIIWNLTMSEYPIELGRGTDENYGLVLKKLPGTTTDIDLIRGSENGTQKFIYNEQLIIIRDGKIYNGVGAMVK